MRLLARGWLAAVLISALLQPPSLASSSRVLGLVVQAEGAQVGSSQALPGTSVYDGERITTDATGSLRVQLGPSQLYLPSGSTATLRQQASLTTAFVERGTVVLSAAAGDPIEIQASSARIVATTGKKAVTQVTLLGPYEFEVGSQQGEIEVTIGEETRTVREGSGYRVEIDRDEQGPRGAGTKENKRPRKAGRSRFFFILLGGIGGLTGYFVVEALESPDRPL